MRIIVDACSIILLARATVFEELTKWKNLTISEEVYNEVLKGKDKKLLDALLLERLVKEKNIGLKKANQKIVNKLINDFSLGYGEAESIALALESKNVLLTDNKQGRKAAKIYGLTLIGSIEVIVSLYKNKRINKEKSLSALHILRRHGWFHDYLIEEAIKNIENE